MHQPLYVRNPLSEHNNCSEQSYDKNNYLFYTRVLPHEFQCVTDRPSYHMYIGMRTALSRVIARPIATIFAPDILREIA